MPGLLNPDQAAERLGISKLTLYKWCRARRVPFIKDRGMLRFDPVELELWVDERRVPAKAAR